MDQEPSLQTMGPGSPHQQLAVLTSLSELGWTTSQVWKSTS